MHSARLATTLNLLLIARFLFSDINVSQRSVATYATRGGFQVTANLPRSLPVKIFVNRLRSDRIRLWPRVRGLTFRPTLTCSSGFSGDMLTDTHAHIRPITTVLFFLPRAEK